MRRARRVRNQSGLISLAPSWLSDEELRQMGLEVLQDQDPQEEVPPQPPEDSTPERARRRR